MALLGSGLFSCHSLGERRTESYWQPPLVPPAPYCTYPCMCTYPHALATHTHCLSPLTPVCVHKYIDQHFSMLLLTMEVLPSVSGEGTGRRAFHSTLLTVAAEAHTRGFVPCVGSRSFAMTPFIFWSLQLVAVVENQGFTWNQLSGPGVTASGCPI